MPRKDHSLESLGISSNEHLEALKKNINAELASEGYEFTKMSLDGLQLSHTVEEAADLVRHAQPISAVNFY